MEALGVYTTLAVICGLIVGSFLNVVIYRLPLNMLGTRHVSKFNIAWPGSHCPLCEHPLSILDNLPILSYLVLKGRCHYCHKPISPQYPLVEAAIGLGWGLIAFNYGLTIAAVALMGLLAILTVIALIDLKTGLIPDVLTIPLIAGGIGLSFSESLTTLPLSLLGALVGYGLPWGINLLFQKIKGKTGMGEGDFKLFAALGAVGGILVLPWIWFIASGLVLIIGFWLIGPKDKTKQVYFGPYIVIAGLISIFWSKMLYDLILKIG